MPSKMPELKYKLPVYKWEKISRKVEAKKNVIIPLHPF